MMAWYGGAACLGLASFLPVYLLYRWREPFGVQVSLGIVILALHAVSLANVFAGTLPGAHWDAETFHSAAAKMAALGTWPEVSMGTKFYELILTATYRVFGAHLLVGQSLSVVAAASTLVLIDRVAVSVGMQDARIRSAIILVSGLYPAFLYHGALTFREPYELLGLVVGTYFVLNMFQKFSWTCVAGAIGGFLFMGLFHHVLLGICIVLICLFVLLLYSPKLGNVRGTASLAGLMLLISATGYVVITNIPITLENNYVKEIRKEHGIINAIARYRASIERVQPRTSFGLTVQADSVSGFASSAAMNYWYYLARPFMSDLRRVGDVVPFAGSVVRLVLLAGLLWLVLSRRAFNRNLAYCLGMYLIVTGVWSLGTTNYGQAFRHHSLTDWLAVFMLGYAMCLALRRGGAAADRLEHIR